MKHLNIDSNLARGKLRELMKRTPQLVWLAAPAALLGAAVPAAAEVYLTEAQALAVVLGENVTVHREQKSLTEVQRRKLEESSGLHFLESSYTFFAGTQQGKVAGYALVLDEIGKSEPTTFMVGMSPDGKVTQVAVMVFRESRGWEVKEKRFLRQFRGKTVADPIRVNQDILNFTGATLSSKALARGVKRALLLLEEFYPARSRREPPHSGTLVVPASPRAIAAARELALYRQMRYCMGTLCEIRVWSPTSKGAGHAFAAAFAELERIDQIFSNYREDSELARVNREAAAGPMDVSPEFWELMRYAVSQWRESRGSFDITVGPLLKAWGFWQGAPCIPAASELAEARTRVGTDKLELDSRSRTVHFRRQGMEIDFGGLAKGYAAMRVAQSAQRHGALATLVNLGGSSLYAAASEVSAAESAEYQRQTGLRIGAWPIGVANPHEPRQFALYLMLEPPWALSTSGTYEQQFLARGRMVSHLIDPRTGWPVEGLRSATVLARSARHTELLAKRLLISTPKEPHAFREMMAGSDWALLEGYSYQEPQNRAVRHALVRSFRRTTELIPV